MGLPFERANFQTPADFERQVPRLLMTVPLSFAYRSLETGSCDEMFIERLG